MGFLTSLACAYPLALGGYATKLAASTIGEQTGCGYACKNQDDGNPLALLAPLGDTQEVLGGEDGMPGLC